MAYAELYCVSNFSFLRGASHPGELVERAAALGYQALALTDECSVAGVVRAHETAARHDLALIIGTELALVDGPRIVLLAPDRSAYSSMCRLISRARGRATKGAYQACLNDLDDGLAGALALVIVEAEPVPGSDVSHGTCGEDLALEPALVRLHQAFPGRLWLAVSQLRTPDDAPKAVRAKRLAEDYGLPVTACGAVHMHRPSRRPLQDTLTAIRLNKPLAAIGYALFPNAQRCLRPLAELEALYPRDWLAESIRIAERCRFCLDELVYQYPNEILDPRIAPDAQLRAATETGLQRRWPGGAPTRVRALVERELGIITELGYEKYFLTVHCIVAWAKAQGILCQGRGSAANSAVCFCLGITEVDPTRMEMLFERFVSKERNEPPDIDVDFEHERREEVIQFIYRHFGRHRAALAAAVICYRPRSAVRDVGKALGLPADRVDRLARGIGWWDGARIAEQRLRDAGLDPNNPTVQRLHYLLADLIGMPRHLSQHTGGFVISDSPLDTLVPIEPAAMAERSIVQWDKDDLDTLGILKIDILALGMLSALRRGLDLLAERNGAAARPAIADLPAEDAEVYAMVSRGDTVGVFQIESPAQMSMLPRLRPRCFYDLVIEVAIVRPGPIQGRMVHPYLARRQGSEPVDYPNVEVASVLERTLGVPIFQEQVIRLAMVCAGFSGGEADQLRRAMAAWQRRGGLEPFHERLVSGMTARGYDTEFAERVFQQILGFGSYGFPESHAASFAILVYASAWLKCRHPAIFLTALLNAQPLGFYSPSQLIQDAKRHGVSVQPVRVEASNWQAQLEAMGTSQEAVRLGLRQVKGLGQAAAERIERARNERPFESVHDLTRRAHLDRKSLDALASAGALQDLAGHRHQARWISAVCEPAPKLAALTPAPEPIPELAAPTEGANLLEDYASLGLTLGRHPLALLRPRLIQLGEVTSQALRELPPGRRVRVTGLVTSRQRPGSAKGTVFISLEDEAGTLRAIIWPKVFEAHRQAVLQSGLMTIQGEIQRQDGVTHLIARRVLDRSRWIRGLRLISRDFH